MKKQFLSLALLVSVSVFAAHNITTTIVVGERADTYEWTSDEVLVAENNSGIVIESRIVQANDESAVINVTITKKSGDVIELLQSGDTTVALGQEVAVKCPAEGVETSISYVVTKQAENVEAPEVAAQDVEVVQENSEVAEQVGA